MNSLDHFLLPTIFSFTERLSDLCNMSMVSRHWHAKLWPFLRRISLRDAVGTVQLLIAIQMEELQRADAAGELPVLRFPTQILEINLNEPRAEQYSKFFANLRDHFPPSQLLRWQTLTQANSPHHRVLLEIESCPVRKIDQYFQMTSAQKTGQPSRLYKLLSILSDLDAFRSMTTGLCTSVTQDVFANSARIMQPIIRQAEISTLSSLVDLSRLKLETKGSILPLAVTRTEVRGTELVLTLGNSQEVSFSWYNGRWRPGNGHGLVPRDAVLRVR